MNVMFAAGLCFDLERRVIDLLCSLFTDIDALLDGFIERKRWSSFLFICFLLVWFELLSSTSEPSESIIIGRWEKMFRLKLTS